MSNLNENFSDERNDKIVDMARLIRRAVSSSDSWWAVGREVLDAIDHTNEAQQLPLTPWSAIQESIDRWTAHYGIKGDTDGLAADILVDLQANGFVVARRTAS